MFTNKTLKLIFIFSFLYLFLSSVCLHSQELSPGVYIVSGDEMEAWQSAIQIEYITMSDGNTVPAVVSGGSSFNAGSSYFKGFAVVFDNNDIDPYQFVLYSLSEVIYNKKEQKYPILVINQAYNLLAIPVSISGYTKTYALKPQSQLAEGHYFLSYKSITDKSSKGGFYFTIDNPPPIFNVKKSRTTEEKEERVTTREDTEYREPTYKTHPAKRTTYTGTSKGIIGGSNFYFALNFGRSGGGSTLGLSGRELGKVHTGYFNISATTLKEKDSEDRTRFLILGYNNRWNIGYINSIANNFGTLKGILNPYLEIGWGYYPYMDYGKRSGYYVWGGPWNPDTTYYNYYYGKRDVGNVGINFAFGTEFLVSPPFGLELCFKRHTVINFGDAPKHYWDWHWGVNLYNTPGKSYAMTNRGTGQNLGFEFNFKFDSGDFNSSSKGFTFNYDLRDKPNDASGLNVSAAYTKFGGDLDLHIFQLNFIERFNFGAMEPVANLFGMQKGKINPYLEAGVGYNPFYANGDMSWSGVGFCPGFGIEYLLNKKVSLETGFTRRTIQDFDIIPFKYWGWTTSINFY